MGLFSYFNERSLYKDLGNLISNWDALKREYRKFDKLVLSPRGSQLYQIVEQDLELFIKKANSMPQVAKSVHLTVHGKDIYLPTILSMIQSDLDEIKRNCQ